MVLTSNKRIDIVFEFFSTDVATERVSVSMQVEIAYAISLDTNLSIPVIYNDYLYKVKQSVSILSGGFMSTYFRYKNRKKYHTHL